MRTIYKTIFLSASLFSLTACENFLNELPDNRTELNDKNVGKMLLSAYPTTAICEIGEMASDNTDQYPNIYSEYNLLQTDLFKWADSSEVGQDSPSNLWQSCYQSIASCNEVLLMIEKAGNPTALNAVRGEALVCRAFNHFLLANVFCHAYSSKAANQLGIPYMKEVETTVAPSYQRGTLEKTYQNIEADLLAGMPLLADESYQVPKYHFTKNAAYAFAARFYLYYVQPDKSNYDKVIDYATRILGTNANGQLRDWETLGSLDMNGNLIPNTYVSINNNSNLLLQSAYSWYGYLNSPYAVGERFSHGPEVAMETCKSNGPWGNFNPSKEKNVYYMFPWSNSSALPTKTMWVKYAQYSEIIDPVAGTGYGHIINAVFTTDETLLCRAEAYAMKGSAGYESAINDLNVWQSAFTRATLPLTMESIQEFYGKMDYYTPAKPTVKKQLHPDFNIQQGEQENLMHCILHARRLTTLHEGLRWMDIKRLGIVIQRRLISSDGSITVTDELNLDDERRAIQIPSDVIAAGMQPNPRNK